MAGKMKSMSGLSPGCSESEHSEEMTDLDEKEKYEEKVKKRKQDEETPPKKKMKKRRTAGDRSGRQMALRRIKQEKKKKLGRFLGHPFLPLKRLQEPQERFFCSSLNTMK